MSPPASWTALEHMAVVQQPVQHCRDGGAVAQQLAPVVDGSVTGLKDTGYRVAIEAAAELLR